MLTARLAHPWDLTPREAIALQTELASKVDPHDGWEALNSVAGIDVSIKHGLARAAVAVLALPSLELVELRQAEGRVEFPYIPGLLSFREAPVILEALANLHTTPDVLIFDGQGCAHPRRLGIASHIGILLDHPTIGCAKSRLCGAYQEPDVERGAHTWLLDNDEVIGAVLRTRARVKPVFVSIGHKVSLPGALEIIQRCCSRYRLPEPTRRAHNLALRAMSQRIEQR
jgi:deoxyribonuclease V